MHDLSNPLAIAQGNVKLVLRKLNKDPNSLAISEIMERLTKASDAFDRATEMIADRRSDIAKDENMENKAS